MKNNFNTVGNLALSNNVGLGTSNLIDLINQYCGEGKKLVTESEVIITPEDAKKLKEEGKLVHTRPLKVHKVKIYAERMRNGEWSYCPDSIAFDMNGFLCNGNTRLNACIEANVPFKTKVDFNAERNQYQDQGTSRTLRDNMCVNGIKEGKAHYSHFTDMRVQCTFKSVLRHFGYRDYDLNTTDCFDEFYNVYKDTFTKFCNVVILSDLYPKAKGCVYAAPFLSASFIAYSSGKVALDTICKIQKYIYELNKGMICRDTLEDGKYEPVYYLYRHYYQNKLADGANKDACFMDTLVTLYCIVTGKKYKFSKSLTREAMSFFDNEYNNNSLRFHEDWHWISMR